MSCELCGSGVLTGILWPVWPEDCDAPDGWSWVQRCHACERYPDDEAAAVALQEIGFGNKLQWFDRNTHEAHDRQADAACSLAIDFPEQWRATPWISGRHRLPGPAGTRQAAGIAPR